VVKLYFVLVAMTALERLAEIVVSTSNARWSLARGGRETGRGHFPAMVALHTAFLVGCVVEPVLRGRTSLPAIAPLALAVAIACQALRWWCIATLGRQWNTRVIVVAGLPRISTGPYRWLRHPNYVAVAVEGIALPAVSGAWITAGVFTLANALLLWTRLRAENRALEALCDSRNCNVPAAAPEAAAAVAPAAAAAAVAPAAEAAAVEGEIRGFGNRA
jgi:methyltransferase